MDYLEVEETLQFTYSGATGPDKWASLNPNFSLCATGKLQSPINIVSARAVRNSKWKPLIRNYRAVNVTLVDNKFTVAVRLLLKLDKDQLYLIGSNIN